MSGKRVLLLGGIGEALSIARRLGPQHLYSLAGLGKVPDDLACQVRVGGYGGAEGLAQFISEQGYDLACQVRVGGYGGAEGLAQFIVEHGYDLLLDATHPYAAQISANAARAAQLAGVPCWALRRPGWRAGAGDDWREVRDWAALIEASAPFRRPLFTLGREPLEHLHEIPAEQFWTVRCLQNLPGTERAEVLGARGPFTLEGERELFERLGTDVLISKNSGSQATEPKLQVARERGIPVLILARPELPTVDRQFEGVEEMWEALGPLVNG